MFIRLGDRESIRVTNEEIEIRARRLFRKRTTTLKREEVSAVRLDIDTKHEQSCRTLQVHYTQPKGFWGLPYEMLAYSAPQPAKDGLFCWLRDVMTRRGWGIEFRTDRPELLATSQRLPEFQPQTAP
jgi:hypothetical protein